MFSKALNTDNNENGNNNKHMSPSGKYFTPKSPKGDFQTC
jgi:hypothetical protein